MNQLLSRRDVVKTILVTSATSLIGNKLWAAKVVSDVAAAPAGIDPDLGIARVQLSSFAALNNNGGSVRLGSSGVSGEFPLGLFYPILINRISATEYVVLDTQCTHAGCVIPAVSGGINGNSTCPCHGSRFNIRGEVQPGSEANFDLLTYQSSLNSGILTINFPGFGFAVTQQTVLNAAEKRLELTFQAFRNVEYEVRFRTNPGALPTVAVCSATLAGAVNRQFVASTVNGNMKLFVLPQDGIYQVAIRMRAA